MQHNRGFQETIGGSPDTDFAGFETRLYDAQAKYLERLAPVRFVIFVAGRIPGVHADQSACSLYIQSNEIVRSRNGYTDGVHNF